MISEETQCVALISLAKPFQKSLHTSAFILSERVNREVIISGIGVSPRRALKPINKSLKWAPNQTGSAGEEPAAESCQEPTCKSYHAGRWVSYSVNCFLLGSRKPVRSSDRRRKVSGRGSQNKARISRLRRHVGAYFHALSGEETDFLASLFLFLFFEEEAAREESSRRWQLRMPN